MKRLIVATLALLTLNTAISANTGLRTENSVAKSGIVQEKKKKKTTRKKTTRKKAHSGQKANKDTKAKTANKTKSLPKAAPKKTTGSA